MESVDRSAPARLRDLQAAFMRDIYARSVMLAPAVRERSGRSAEAQIAVYRGSVYGNLTNALNETFPVTRRLLGERFFDAMALRYVRAHPPTTPWLADLGEQFSAFAQGFAPLAELPWVVDVAKLEWLWHRAFHAADAQPWEASSLALLAPEAQAASVLQLRPGMHWMQSCFAVDVVWSAHQQSDVADFSAAIEPAAPRWLLVYRDGFEVGIERLTDAESELLRGMAAGLPLADLLQHIQGLHPATDPGALLGTAFSRQWVAGFIQPSD